MAKPPFQNQKIEEVYAAYPPRMRKELLTLRSLIFETASEIEGVGPLEETLKWGQPSYLTSTTKSGTTIRLDQLKGDKERYALFVHCQTNLMDQLRTAYADEVHIEGNRALHFEIGNQPPRAIVRHCIAQALTYHLNKPKKQR